MPGEDLHLSERVRSRAHGAPASLPASYFYFALDQKAGRMPELPARPVLWVLWVLRFPLSPPETPPALLKKTPYLNEEERS